MFSNCIHVNQDYIKKEKSFLIDIVLSKQQVNI